ncbi:MAG: hypothetical protein CL569_19385 [Alphaproteobacteria bacterium]|nr:hypothetical protein [Alphaproteobacteria bacterium]
MICEILDISESDRFAENSGRFQKFPLVESNPTRDGNLDVRMDSCAFEPLLERIAFRKRPINLI